jgi:hypothetical protein
MAEQELPQYELVQPFYAPDSVLYQEGTILGFDGIPNEWMRPLNARAEAAYDAYMRSLPDGRSEPLEKVVERAMMARPRIEDSNAASQIIDALKLLLRPAEANRNAKVVARPVGDLEKPVMGNDPRALKDIETRRTTTMVVEEVAIEPRVKKPVPVMGTVRQYGSKH